MSQPERPGDGGGTPVGGQPRTWRQMRENITRMLVERTGEDIEAWNRRMGERDFADEAELNSWLTERGVTGYPRMLLVMERFGYPDYLLATADELIDDQYEDRSHLRPVLDAVVAAVQALGPVEVQARKTYVSLLSPKRTFAAVKPTTRQRVDVGLRIDGQRPGGRLQDGSTLAGGSINLRIGLGTVDDLDDEAIELLRRAYAANL